MRRAVSRGLFVALLLSVGPSRVSAEPAGAELERAYRKEFAFLEAEKRTLEKRLAEVERETQEKLLVGEAEVQRLQSRLMALGVQSDQIAQSISDVERQMDVALSGEDVLENTLTQASAQLEKGNIVLPEPEKGPDGKVAPLAQTKQLEFAFDKSIELLNTYGTVRTSQGEYFDASGKEVKGQIVQVGNVAAFAAGNTAGALVPVGGGKLKVFNSALGEATAQGLAQKRPPGTIGLFLFDSVEKAVEEKHEKTLEDIMRGGGVIGWVIVAIGIVALLMILARALILMRNAANTERLVEQVAPLVQRRDIQGALALCERARNAPGRVLKATLEHLDRAREQLEDVISERIMKETPAIDRFGGAILVIAAVAPLLGLLGTVTGMISTFDVITEYGTGNPKLLSGGISEALITTEFGLIVAIPGMLIGNILNAWAEGIKTDMDRAALRITNIAAGKEVAQRIEEEAAAPVGAGLAPAE
jgi:biopolymer transport protein ExbB